MTEIYYALVIVLGIFLTILGVALAIRIVSGKNPLITVTNIRTTHIHRSETSQK